MEFFAKFIYSNVDANIIQSLCVYVFRFFVFIKSSK